MVFPFSQGQHHHTGIGSNGSPIAMLTSHGQLHYGVADNSFITCVSVQGSSSRLVLFPSLDHIPTLPRHIPVHRPSFPNNNVMFQTSSANNSSSIREPIFLDDDSLPTPPSVNRSPTNSSPLIGPIRSAPSAITFFTNPFAKDI